MKLKQFAVAVLMAAFVLHASPSWAQQGATVVDRAAVDQAVAEKVKTDESARTSIRTLLERDDVKAMADGAGLDVRRAATAVSTLEGTELQHVASQASAANDLLAGGDFNIRISLVAILLIVIIIILLAK